MLQTLPSQNGFDAKSPVLQGTGNAATHKDVANKTEVGFVWTPPSQRSGMSVLFVATVVHEHRGRDSVWYEDVESNIVDY